MHGGSWLQHQERVSEFFEFNNNLCQQVVAPKKASSQENNTLGQKVVAPKEASSQNFSEQCESAYSSHMQAHIVGEYSEANASSSTVSVSSCIHTGNHSNRAQVAVTHAPISQFQTLMSKDWHMMSARTRMIGERLMESNITIVHKHWLLRGIASDRTKLVLVRRVCLDMILLGR